MRQALDAAPNPKTLPTLTASRQKVLLKKTPETPKPSTLRIQSRYPGLEAEGWWSRAWALRPLLLSWEGARAKHDERGGGELASFATRYEFCRCPGSPSDRADVPSLLGFSSQVPVHVLFRKQDGDAPQSLACRYKALLFEQ